MANRDIVVIGASAGGIEALQVLLRGLPADLDATILIALHTSSHAGSMLPNIMQRASKMPVLHPEDRTRVRKRHIYVAPPDFHMIVEGSHIRVLQGPRENLHRPAIDPLFRSAATCYGPRVIGVVLTGLLDDGTYGLMAVQVRGGVPIVQDPETALFSSMPRNAWEQVPDARAVPLEDIPDLLVRLIGEEVPDYQQESQEDDRDVRETRLAEVKMSEVENEHRNGHPSAFACPECGGVLWETDDDNFLRFRCRVGHAFTARHLGAEQRHAIETALWSALRSLEENASLYRRMAERAATSSHQSAKAAFDERAANISANARVLRDFLLQVNQQDDEGEQVQIANEQAS